MEEVALKPTDERASQKRKAEEITPEENKQQNAEGIAAAAAVPVAAVEDTPAEQNPTKTIHIETTTVEQKDAYSPSAENGGALIVEVQPSEKPPAVAQVATKQAEQPQQAKPPPAAQSRNPYDDLKWIVVRNDGKAESMIKLVGLKSLFAKQLPKMPRTYISRLVFDRRHTSLAILSQNPAVKDSDEEIIGGICYRAFPDQRFAEIAFCAVNATHQVKGYGTKLMNLLKKIAAETGIEYFITYADNYAIGYFKKQGFTKNISMPKGRFHGLIKDYDGGTPMECYVHSSIDFTRIPEMIRAQREFILSRVELTATSKNVYPALPKNFSPSLEGVSRLNQMAARALAIPGIVEAGWTMADLIAATGQGKEADRQKSALKSELLVIIRKVEEQQFAWPFREPVDTDAVHDYLDVIKEPIDLSTIEKRIRQDAYKSKQQVFLDLQLMCNNCKIYNDEASMYVQCAVKLEKFVRTLFPDIPTGRAT